MTIDIIIMVLMVASAMWAVMSPNLLKAAIGLAVASAVLAIIMFRLDAPLAAVFELSVCAGLITVVFVSVISLTRPPEGKDPKPRVVLRRFAFLPLLVLIAAVAFGMLELRPDFSSLPAMAPEAGMRVVLWGERQLDLFAQVVVLLTGVFGVVVLFKERQKGN
ncbi:MAG: NADH-quinone oxidoreductase subunit J [Kiritimatiellia bacterium]